MPKKKIGIVGTERLAPPKKGVTVRMYHTGFGDCFLLAFRSEDGKARYMLIDCGVHQRWEGGKKRMELVAQDIGKATGNKLHVVAVTHEHTDHISGFLQGESAFKKIEIDEVWLAWTEDPSDPVAKQLKEQYGKKIRALKAAIAGLKEAQNPLGFHLESLLGFDLQVEDAAFSGNADTMNTLRSWSKKKLERPEDYRTPGEAPLTLPGVKGIKCYVLGPPRDIESIKILEARKETYLRLEAMDKETAFMAAAAAASKMASSEDEDLFSRSNPFDRSLMIAVQEASSHQDFGAFFQEHYGLSGEEKSNQEWRQINSDWLDAASELALSINSMTNNTSLVLAFELTETKPPKVLLFAGDAQAGNWQSWQKLEWPEDEEAEEGKARDEWDKKKITGADLLRRTVLYKVGHHGSLNATLRERGLEMMESRELVAMIPVDGSWAAEEMRWNIPAGKLVKRLMEKARGKVLRSDQIPTGGAPNTPPEATDGEWESFLKNLEWDTSPDHLWIQYTVEG